MASSVVVVGLVAASVIAGGALPASSAEVPAGTSGRVTTGVPAALDPSGSRIDVDGDGRADRTSLTKVATTRDDYTFRLAVRTAAGRSVNLPVKVPNYRDNVTAEEVWVGAAGVDGVRGGELILDLGGGVGDFPAEYVYTWRSGRLVTLRPPGARSGRTPWAIADHWLLVQGYTFSMRRGVRYVVAHDLKNTSPGSTITYQGTHTTYRWARTSWVKVSSKPSGVLPESAHKKYASWHGLVWR